MKKHWFVVNYLFFFCIVFVATVFVGAVLAESAPPEAVAAAEDGLLPFLNLITPQDMENFGFSPGDDISQAVLGTPFHLYTITPEKLLNAEENSPVSSLISPTGSWFFPVVLEEKFRAILTVAQMGGKWQAVGIGKADLAGQIQEVVTQWPKSKGYDPVLIIIFQANSYFFAVPQKDDYNLNSFVFDGKGFEGEEKTGPQVYSNLTELAKIMEELKSVVAENIKGHN